MERKPIPLIILGGRDRRAAVLPEGGREKHPLGGYKAVETRIGGRPLISVLLERLRSADVFEPIYVAGPRRVYEGLELDAEIIDTDGELGENIRTAIEVATAAGMPWQLGFVTCDILPEPGELRTVVDDLYAHQPADFYLLESRVPADLSRLGASAWKPKYYLRPPGEERAVPVLPGHLVVVDPAAVRLKLLYRFFDLNYRTRNRPLSFRKTVMARNLLWTLVVEDVRRALSLRFPNITWLVALNGLALAAKLKARSLGQGEIEDHLRRIFVRNRHRRQHPERRGRVPILDALSFARDIDTEEEAREIARRALRAEGLPQAGGQ